MPFSQAISSYTVLPLNSLDFKQERNFPVTKFTQKWAAHTAPLTTEPKACYYRTATRDFKSMRICVIKACLNTPDYRPPWLSALFMLAVTDMGMKNVHSFDFRRVWFV